MLKVTADFNLDALNAIIDSDTTEWFDELLEDYRTAGRQFVERARSKVRADGSFNNITWNLRSSIGYLLVNNGNVIESHFPTLEGAAEGSTTGDSYAHRIVSENDDLKDGVALVCVAGMDYAYYVEAKEYDVISGSSDYFELELKELLGT